MNYLANGGVALRKESVDRNCHVFMVTCGLLQSLSARRAWIEILPGQKKKLSTRSLSARRAWIEMRAWAQPARTAPVALRKESVDRNFRNRAESALYRKSLSARRAWIEIVVEYKRAKEKAVALRKESVDRNSAKTIRRDIASMPVALRKESVDRNFYVPFVSCGFRVRICVVKG